MMSLKFKGLNNITTVLMMLLLICVCSFIIGCLHDVDRLIDRLIKNLNHKKFFEIQVTNDNTYYNPFDFDEIELQAVFTSPTGREIDFFGFYDGDGNGGQTGNVWRLRFMPDEFGIWTYTYTWTDGTPGGSGDFLFIGLTNPKNHGHVHVDPNHPRYLIHDDGTPHYWWGANWISCECFGPQSKWGELNLIYVTDEQFITWLDTLEDYDHNGILLKMGLYPLEDDKISWDLEWLHREDWLLSEMAARGIYAHINFFDTWSRGKGGWDYSTDGDQHVFNVWKSGDEGAKKNYIKTIIARFASFPNVYWELGNEMEHSPNSGPGFVNQANSKYIPWIRQYDPYDLPIGLSEGVWHDANVDIGFLHQTGSLPSTSWNQPTIMNELVSGGISGDLWEDSTIRNSVNRLAYRRTFWRMFTHGGSGSSEATWYEFTVPPNQAVRDVMADQQRLRNFIEVLPVNINEMDTDSSFVTSGPGSYRTRSKHGVAYVTYFLLNPGQFGSAGTARVTLPEGSYDLIWYDPKDGFSTASTTVYSGGGTVTLSHPAFDEDVVLKVLQSSIPVADD